MSKAASSPPPKLVIYGHVGFDTANIAGRLVRRVGGAAYYAAVGASQVSSSVGLVTVIGRDFPYKHLESLEVDLMGVLQSDRTSAEFCQEYDESESVTRFHGQLNACASLTPRSIPLDYMKAQIVFLTTAPPTQQIEALTWLRRNGFRGRIAIDTCYAYTEGFNSVLRKHAAELCTLFVNAREYQALKWGPPKTVTVVVKRGASGVSFFQRGLWMDIPAPEVDQVYSTTGAGDVLAGSYLARVAVGLDMKTAITNAVEAASNFVGRPDHARTIYSSSKGLA